jgi:hypothetical protein
MVFTTVGGLYVTRISHGFYHCWWTVIHKISQGFYHCWWTVSDKDITRFLPLLVDCHSQGYHKVFTTVGGLSVTRISQGFYQWLVDCQSQGYHKVFTNGWWTVSHKDITRFLPLLVDCHSQGYHKVFTTVGGLAVTRISQGFYHCWWTVSHKNISRFADRWIPSWCGSGRQIEYTLLMRGGCVW